MRWDQAADEYLERASEARGGLASLQVEWQRELVALCHAVADVSNGAYLEFVANHSRETYVQATQAFKKIGAHRMAEIIDECQALIDEHNPTNGKADYWLLRSVLPEEVQQRIHDLSYEFMDFPDEIGDLGNAYFGPRIAADLGMELE